MKIVGFKVSISFMKESSVSDLNPIFMEKTMQIAKSDCSKIWAGERCEK